MNYEEKILTYLVDNYRKSKKDSGDNKTNRRTQVKPEKLYKKYSAREVGIPLVPHRAKQITFRDYDNFDYIIGMDTANMRNLNRMLKGDPEGKIYKFLTFAGSGRDIADPWYTGDFDATYNDVVEGCKGFLEYLKENGEIDPMSRFRTN